MLSKQIQCQVTYATIAIGLIEPQIIEKPKVVEEDQGVLNGLLIQPFMVACGCREPNERPSYTGCKTVASLSNNGHRLHCV